MTNYVSLATLKEYLNIQDTDNDTELQRSLDAADEWINSYCERTFELDAVDTTRVFYPNPDGTVTLPDLQTVTTVKTDTTGDQSFPTTWAATEYELLPLDGPPYTMMRPWPTSSKAFGHNRLVQVVGKFGTTIAGGTPASVKTAACILASRFYHRKDAPFGVLQSVDLGQFTRISKEDPDVISLLAPYKSTSGWVVV